MFQRLTAGLRHFLSERLLPKLRDGSLKQGFKESLAEFWRSRGDLGWLLAYALIPTSMLAGAVAMWQADVGVLQDLRNEVFDTYQRIHPRPYNPEASVQIVDIDDASLSRLGQWPWPRTLVAELVERLGDAGAGVIVFDMVFAEPDRTSPDKVAETFPKGPGFARARESLKGLPGYDRILARAFAQAAVVTGFTLVPEDNGVRPNRPSRVMFASKQKGLRRTSEEIKAAADGNADAALIRRMAETEAADPKEYLPDWYDGAVANLPLLEKAAQGNGAFSIRPDRDGVIRKVPMLYKMGGEIYPALSAEALRVAMGTAGFKVWTSGSHKQRDFGESSGLVKIMIGPLAVPTDGMGHVIIHDTGYREERYVPAWKLLEKDFDPSSVAGKIVFIGTSAMGLKDQRATPLSPVVPGVEIHAMVAEQILTQEFLNRPVWADLAELLFLLVFGITVLLLMAKLGAAWCALICGFAIAGAVGGSWYAFTHKRLLLDPIYPSLVVGSIYLASSLIGYLKSEKEKAQIRGAFGRYLSPVLVEQLASHPEKLKLGGELRRITIHFCDIRGFTSISEKMDPATLTHFINKFLTPMTEIILAHKGCIDKYIGDCIMAYWNAPMDDPDHIPNSCRAVLAMHARLKTLNEELKAEAEAGKREFIPIKIGTGLNTGNAVVGNLGSEQRFDYSVLGDDVNLASRLEGQSKPYGVKIVLGPATQEAATDFATLELDLIRVKGKLRPVNIHTLLGEKEYKESPEFQELSKAHAAMIAAYRGQGWDEASKLLEECRRLGPDLHGLYDLYAKRIAAFRAESPGKDWDGVFVATTK